MSKLFKVMLISTAITAAMIAAAWQVWGLEPTAGFLFNVAFLFLGMAVAISAQCIITVFSRHDLKKDLTLSLHMEISDRLARCCFDLEYPWQAYITRDGASNSDGPLMNAFRLRKYLPVPAIIYPAVASQCSVLDGKQIQAALQFYFRLSAIERDIENLAREYDSKPDAAVALSQGRMIALRFQEAMTSGLAALEALGIDPDAKSREDSAIKMLDDGKLGECFRGKPGPLRARIQNKIDQREDNAA